MPTARPIIIEKFIDHTDIGVTQPRTCKSANPTAMPASARTSGRPAAISAPNATNNRIMRGQAAEQLGLVECFGVDRVEVAPHRPFAGDLGVRAGRAAWSLST